MNDFLADAWLKEDGVTCVSCPECAFTFDAFHTDVDSGGYSCTACAELRLEDEAKILNITIEMLQGYVRNLILMLIDKGVSMSEIVAKTTGVEE